MDVFDLCVKFHYWEFIIVQYIYVKNESEKTGFELVFSLSSSKYHMHHCVQENVPFYSIYHIKL